MSKAPPDETKDRPVVSKVLRVDGPGQSLVSIVLM